MRVTVRGGRYLAATMQGAEKRMRRAISEAIKEAAMSTFDELELPPGGAGHVGGIEVRNATDGYRRVTVRWTE